MEQDGLPNSSCRGRKSPVLHLSCEVRVAGGIPRSSAAVRDGSLRLTPDRRDKHDQVAAGHAQYRHGSQFGLQTPMIVDTTRRRPGRSPTSFGGAAAVTSAASKTQHPGYKSEGGR